MHSLSRKFGGDPFSMEDLLFIEVFLLHSLDVLPLTEDMYMSSIEEL